MIGAIVGAILATDTLRAIMQMNEDQQIGVIIFIPIFMLTLYGIILHARGQT